MKLSSPYEYDSHPPRFPMMKIIVAMVLTTVVVGGILYLGSGSAPKTEPTVSVKETAGGDLSAETAQTEEGTVESSTQAAYHADGAAKDIEKLYQENKLTAQDLDFWDMYPEEMPELVNITELEEEGASQEEEDLTIREKYEAKEAEANGVTAESRLNQDDETKTLLTYADKTEEWVQINPYLEKHTYDFTKLVKKADELSYMENGKNSAYLGADLSKYNGTVDFKALKEAGVDFVMLRVGARGYGSGEIKADESYVQNIAGAAEAGLDVGLYFFSQAITADEAVEEANYLLSSIGEYKITYPIAFDMEYVSNDTARIEALSKESKTAVAKAFLDTIKNAGHKPMIYGTKEWLIKEIDLTRLTGYEVWLSQQKEVPDYPYQFQMWQYTTEGSISGVTGNVDLNISFIDYSEK